MFHLFTLLKVIKNGLANPLVQLLYKDENVLQVKVFAYSIGKGKGRGRLKGRGLKLLYKFINSILFFW